MLTLVILTVMRHHCVWVYFDVFLCVDALNEIRSHCTNGVFFFTFARNYICTQGVELSDSSFLLNVLMQ